MAQDNANCLGNSPIFENLKDLIHWIDSHSCDDKVEALTLAAQVVTELNRMGLGSKLVWPTGHELHVYGMPESDPWIHSGPAWICGTLTPEAIAGAGYDPSQFTDEEISDLARQVGESLAFGVGGIAEVIRRVLDGTGAPKLEAEGGEPE